MRWMKWRAPSITPFEVVPTAALMPAAERAMDAMLKMPDGARAATKLNMRGDFSAEWEAFIPEEAAAGWAGPYARSLTVCS